jgi:glycosyltransferase involved in cell wall biosynthesis
MCNHPVISIIVPVYKADRYLPKCLDSILSQTYKDFELILVNDGSPDNSGNICKAYASKDKRIKVINKINGGASTARKAGVEAAKGKYIGWVDADDYIAPDMFSTLFTLAENYDADIAECQYVMVRGNTEQRSGEEESLITGDGDLILNQFFSARMKPAFWNKLYKSELFSKIQFPDRQLHVDFYINMQFALMPLKYVRTSEAKYYYMVRENSYTTTYTGREIREAVYLYDYTMKLALKIAANDQAKIFLVKDAINRLIGRYADVTVYSNILNQRVYNKYIRKILGLSLVKYLLTADLPFKTRISYTLLLFNLKSIQVFLHKFIGAKN